MALKRLQREFRQLLQNPLPVGTIEPTDNPLVWIAYINGPVDTPYEGGKFQVELSFPNNYPIQTPQITFKTKIFHANISSSGRVCISLLQDWRPTDNVATILLAIHDLLVEPDRASAYEGRRLNDYQYKNEAKQWTTKYAK